MVFGSSLMKLPRSGSAAVFVVIPGFGERRDFNTALGHLF
ncbi:hypothetical protein CfE428DRAFT_1565 [Chthoniobacter flavus Ellin428]|uniref:Uncharacterized protein n=1 Tax=Chthoniobacter flavus Ellin428 TaxID=497964 RepID=B4CWV2_9BACT|nr:hypothetical protein CfE428DRAFT_1565 [Chthoniobacter flavus Ellin428]TCO87639.1 hypothetical protein EV701_121142 [Chthoniobacter flavus]